MNQTASLVPLTTGLPTRIFGSIAMRSCQSIKASNRLFKLLLGYRDGRVFANDDSLTVPRTATTLVPPDINPGSCTCGNASLVKGETDLHRACRPTRRSCSSHCR